MSLQTTDTPSAAPWIPQQQQILLGWLYQALFSLITEQSSARRDGRLLRAPGYHELWDCWLQLGVTTSLTWQPKGINIFFSVGRVSKELISGNPEGYWCVWGHGGERGVSSNCPRCTCIPCGCTLHTLSLEVASSAALAAAQKQMKHFPGNTFLSAWGSALAEILLLSLLALATAAAAQLNWLLAQYLHRFIWWGGG